MLIFVTVALWVNLWRTLAVPDPAVVNDLGFAAFLPSLGYVGVQLLFCSGAPSPLH